MDLNQAKETLINFVNHDRTLRNYDIISDFDKMCEEKCIAVEVVLHELEKKRCQCPTK